MVIRYLNDSSDPYLDNFQSDLILTTRLSSHVLKFRVNKLHIYRDKPPPSFFHVFLETSDHELFTRPKPSPLDKRFPREEFETETSSLRRKESFGQVSVVSFGTSFGMYCRKFVIIDSSHFITHIAVCNNINPSHFAIPLAICNKPVAKFSHFVINFQGTLLALYK